MSVVFKKMRDNMYLPVFYRSDAPLVPLEEGHDEEEEIIENNEVIETVSCLSSVSKLVLTEEQHRSAVNKFPFFIIIFTSLMAYFYHSQMVILPGLPFHSLFQYADYILTIVVTLIFGVPLEIAHGTLKISIVVIVSFIAKLILTYGIHDYIYLGADRTQTYVLMTLHYTNIYMKWDQIEKKSIRLFGLTLILASIALVNIIQLTSITPLRSQLIGNYLIDINGAISGLMFGYFWIYGNEKKSIVKYTLILLYILFSLMVGLLVTNIIQ